MRSLLKKGSDFREPGARRSTPSRVRLEASQKAVPPRAGNGWPARVDALPRFSRRACADWLRIDPDPGTARRARTKQARRSAGATEARAPGADTWFVPIMPCPLCLLQTQACIAMKSHGLSLACVLHLSNTRGDDMNLDRLQGKAKEAKGKAKQSIGRATGGDKMAAS